MTLKTYTRFIERIKPTHRPALTDAERADLNRLCGRLFTVNLDALKHGGHHLKQDELADLLVEAYRAIGQFKLTNKQAGDLCGDAYETLSELMQKPSDG